MRMLTISVLIYWERNCDSLKKVLRAIFCLTSDRPQTHFHLFKFERCFTPHPPNVGQKLEIMKTMETYFKPFFSSDFKFCAICYKLIFKALHMNLLILGIPSIIIGSWLKELYENPPSWMPKERKGKGEASSFVASAATLF